jgi:hypothetical protein
VSLKSPSSFGDEAWTSLLYSKIDHKEAITVQKEFKQKIKGLCKTRLGDKQSCEVSLKFPGAVLVMKRGQAYFI